MKFRDSHHPYAFITIIFWSLAYVLTRLTLQYFSTFSLGFIRYFIASCTLITIAFTVKLKCPGRKDLPWFAAAGAVGFFFYMIAFNKGQATVTAATGSVVIATVPVFTALLARFIYGEKLKSYQWLAIAIEFAGVLTLTLMNGMLSLNVGLIWLFSAAIALSSYNLIQRKLTKKYTALQTSSFSIFFGTVMLAIFLPQSVHEVVQAPPVQIFYVLILGIFSSAAAYVMWSAAFAKASQTSQVSNYMFLTPFITSILGLLLADEVPDRATIVGGVIILLGAFVFNFGDRIFHPPVNQLEA